MIAYQEWGDPDGVPVFLQHGFGSDGNVGWVLPGTVEKLVDAGHRVVTIDARGSGASEAPHDPSFYGEHNIAKDLSTLCDALGTGSFDLVGYSHGAIVSLIAATAEPRIRRLVVGGIGAGAVELGTEKTRVVPRWMVAAVIPEDPSSLTDPREMGFRALADLTGADRTALLAKAESRHTAPIALGQISAPTLIVAGGRDPLARSPEILQAAIPGARLVRIDTDHFGVLRDPAFAAAIVDFLTETV